MTQYEYKVLPAPRKGTKAKGVKAPEERFALSIQELMNQEAAQGWEFQRAETLPSEERQRLTSSQVVYRDLLVFRRAVTAQTAPTKAPAETPAQPAVNPPAVKQPTPSEPPTPAASVEKPKAPAPLADPVPATPPRNEPPLGARPQGEDNAPQVIFRAPPRKDD
ncbi:DUF4177 domain-containing protein [Rhodalgimonas zhirmunskyi]|uniref:DUF4177 domain-containing protein n=1 Tax=Rhodalgimonas zhirmunskyi TaxID=2964767 RepID=A0AAJ1X6Q0_9RHOB|nr:DUF4177 domain-containing protein [Rhodoalgimonas zhirmunskyi]MDQ2095434.1 DUF4177 domain-containing protein [Rhodoalgimonas zhirmunskyi]